MNATNKGDKSAALFNNPPLISVAPMMDCTDRHARYFLRLISPNALLYTEMVTSKAILHGDCKKLLDFDAFEHPVVLQLGGSDPAELAMCAKRGTDWGYKEINLNVGCPSSRVQSGRFGACLMLEPERVADCVAAMSAATSIPVTVKCRIGVDTHDSYEALTSFIQMVSDAGCHTFIVHARKAWLDGLSPKENREIPPLQYGVVQRIKRDFPHLTIIINGGIKTIEAIQEHLSSVDGVMIGREAYGNPYFLMKAEHALFDTPLETRETILEKFIPYVDAQLKTGLRLSSISRHILGLFQGESGARAFRRYVSTHAPRPDAGIDVLKKAYLCTR